MSVSLRQYFERRMEDSAVAVKAALAAAEKAVDKAEAQATKWQAASNEWRSAMNDREREYLSRKEFYSIVGTAVMVATLLRMFKFF